MSGELVAQKNYDDSSDILVDLSGHTPKNRLAALFDATRFDQQLDGAMLGMWEQKLLEINRA